MMGSRITWGINCLIADIMRLLNNKTVKKIPPMTTALSAEVDTSNNGQRPIMVNGKLSVFMQVVNIIKSLLSLAYLFILSAYESTNKLEFKFIIM